MDVILNHNLVSQQLTNSPILCITYASKHLKINSTSLSSFTARAHYRNDLIYVGDKIAMPFPIPQILAYDHCQRSNRAKKPGCLGGRIITPRNVGKNSQILRNPLKFAF